MKYAAIADWASEGEFPVKFMSAELEVSTSGYYKWLAAQSQPLGPRASEDAQLLTLIRVLHKYLDGNPGVRRIHAGLLAMDRRVSRKRVHRLMQQAGLQGRHPKAWRKTTIAGDAPAQVSLAA
ncbi:MAG: IS3 family transposase [Tetrasphaera sp.]